MPRLFLSVDMVGSTEFNARFTGQGSDGWLATLFDGGGDYTTWNVGAGYALTEHLGLDLRYHDTAKHRFGDNYDSRVVLSLEVTF